MLYRVVAEHLDVFLEAAANQADGARLPAFVEQESRDFLACGVLAHGFARLRCGNCAAERLVTFSFAANLRMFKGSEADFLRTVRNGRPGTAMTPWKGLISDEDIVSIERYIKQLTP